MAVIDMTNKKCGKWHVLHRDLTKTGGAAYWICQCECGTIKSIRGQALRDGSSIDCGCGKKERQKTTIDTTSLIGQKFGYLIVIERDLSKPIGHGKDPYWICQCNCGNIVSVRGASLKNGSTKSCGCYRKEKNTERCTLDLTNKRFGYLTALENTGKKEHGSYIWKCQCDCGNIHYVNASTLNLGQCSSCGCRTKSRGEEKIEQLLLKFQIPFESEYTFDDCRNPKTGYLYRFDFAIKQNNHIIFLVEYDGEQHFIDKPFYKNSLEERQFNDIFKNQYAKEHNIPLKRIPYTVLNTLTIDDIMGDKYLI